MCQQNLLTWNIPAGSVLFRVFSDLFRDGVDGLRCANAGVKCIQLYRI